VYSSIFCTHVYRALTTTTFDAKPFSNTLWIMSIPYSRAPMVAHVERMLTKVAKFGFTSNNCICLKFCRAFSENLFYAIIVVYETTFQWGIHFLQDTYLYYISRKIFWSSIFHQCPYPLNIKVTTMFCGHQS